MLAAAQQLDLAHLQAGIVGNELVRPYAILLLFFSFAYIGVSLDLSGFIAYAAAAVTRRAGGVVTSKRSLFLRVFLLSSVVTVATSNDVVVLTLTPFVCALTLLMRIDAEPFLYAAYFAANSLSALLLIGNPTNIMYAHTCTCARRSLTRCAAAVYRWRTG